MVKFILPNYPTFRASARPRFIFPHAVYSRSHAARFSERAGPPPPLTFALLYFAPSGAPLSTRGASLPSEVNIRKMAVTVFLCRFLSTHRILVFTRSGVSPRIVPQRNLDDDTLKFGRRDPGSRRTVTYIRIDPAATDTVTLGFLL